MKILDFPRLSKQIQGQESSHQRLAMPLRRAHRLQHRDRPEAREGRAGRSSRGSGPFFVANKPLDLECGFGYLRW